MTSDFKTTAFYIDLAVEDTLLTRVGVIPVTMVSDSMIIPGQAL